MLEKIDKFIDKYLNWRVFKNILLAQLFLLPHSFIVSAFNVPSVLLLIMDLSFGISIAFLRKAFLEIFKK